MGIDLDMDTGFKESVKNESLIGNLKKKFSKADDEIVYDINGNEIGRLINGKLEIQGSNFSNEIEFDTDKE